MERTEVSRGWRENGEESYGLMSAKFLFGVISSIKDSGNGSTTV